MVLKPANKYQVTRQRLDFKSILTADFQHHFISLLSKSFSNIIFTESKMTNCKYETINHSHIYLLFDLLGCQISIFVKPSILNGHLINNISCFKPTDLTSRYHAHCILKTLIRVTHSKHYLGNIWFSGKVRKYIISFLSWTFFTNIKFMN